MTQSVTNFLVLEAFGCGADLSDHAALARGMRRCAEVMDAMPVGDVRQAYTGGGLTLVLMLAESHILISTWPEARYAVAEVFFFNPASKVDSTLPVLTGLLLPSRTEVHRMALSVPHLTAP